MFKREKKVYLELTDKEYRLVRKSLLDWRNKLTAQGRDVSPVNELLTKLMTCG
jgi:5-bromo-4-chloroindolyl phosphate hydrolysis protein